MTDTSSEPKKGIGSIGQPDDPELPGIELLQYPMKRHGRAAIATFKNGSYLMFRFDSEKHLYQETYFSDGHNCESFEVDAEKTPEQTPETGADGLQHDLEGRLPNTSTGTPTGVGGRVRCSTDADTVGVNSTASR